MNTKPKKFEFTFSHPNEKFISFEQKIDLNSKMSRTWSELEKKYLEPVINKDEDFKSTYEEKSSALFGYQINDDLSNLNFLFNHAEISRYSIYTELKENFKVVSGLFLQEVLSLWDTVPEVEYKYPQI